MSNTKKDPLVQKLLISPPNTGSTPHTVGEQDAELVQAVIDHFGADGYKLPIKEDAEEMAELTEREMMFLSKETIMRYITATKRVLTETISRLEYTIKWRRTVEIDDVEAMAEDCGAESGDGKNILLGFTPQAQPIVYFFPARNRTPVERRRAIHAVFMVERAKDLMVEGQTQTMVLFNFAGKKEGPPTSLSAARETLHILSYHYPENLAISYFMNLSWLVKTFVNVMWPFVDSVTKSKVVFCTPEELGAKDHVASDVLLKECGGDVDLPYHHETYWPTLLETCLARREEHLIAWRSLGPPQVGRLEVDFKKTNKPMSFSNETL